MSSLSIYTCSPVECGMFMLNEQHRQKRKFVMQKREDTIRQISCIKEEIDLHKKGLADVLVKCAR